MLRKVDNERLPKELTALLPNTKPEFIVIGGSVFEMCQMSTKDISALKVAFKELFNSFISKKEEISSTDDAVQLIIESGVVPEILRNLYDVSEEDLDGVTIPQLLHIVNTWMNLNFFRLPPESLQNLRQVITYFLTIAASSNESAPNTTTQKTPGATEETPESQTPMESSSAPTTTTQ